MRFSEVEELPRPMSVLGARTFLPPLRTGAWRGTGMAEGLGGAKTEWRPLRSRFHSPRKTHLSAKCARW